jgi:hypothetical protein
MDGVFEDANRPEGVTEEYSAYVIKGGGRYIWFPDKNMVATDLPTDLVEGYALFEDAKPEPCVCNPHDRWNGWHKPQFTEEDFYRIITKMGYKIEDIVVGKENTMLFGSHESQAFDREEADLVAYKELNGRYWMDGWIWHFVSKEEYEKRQLEKV